MPHSACPTCLHRFEVDSAQLDEIVCCPNCNLTLRACDNLVPETTAVNDDFLQNPTVRKNACITAGIISVSIYAILVGLLFAPKVDETFVKAFGEAPIGIPVTAVVIFAETLLYIPIPFVFYHVMVLLFRAQQDSIGAPRGIFSMLAFLVEAEKRFPELRRSVYICVAGLLYSAAIFAAWLWFAQHRGI